MTIKKTAYAAISLLFMAVLFIPATAGAAEVKIKLYGGFNNILAGDLNKGTEGYANFYVDLYKVIGGYAVSGFFKPIHMGLNFGGDVILMITPRFGLGLGSEYLLSSESAAITMTLATSRGPHIVTVTPRAEAGAIPLKVSLFYSFPAAKGLRVNAHLGAGYYKARMENSVRVEDEYYFTQDTNSAKAEGFGFHGGLGFEFDLSPRITLFMEVQGRYAKFGKFEGDKTVQTSDAFDQRSGTLYYGEWQGILPQYYPIIWVLSAVPAPNPYMKNFREAKIDFSGGKAVLGILLRF